LPLAVSPDERRKTVASYRRIEAKPIAGALGAEIASVDLGKLDDETFREIEAAWLEHLVVFFRNQTLTPEQQIAFARRFGEIHHHPFMKGMDEHPEILEVIKEEGDTRAFGRRHGLKPTTHCCSSSSETFQTRGASNADPIAQCKVD
jgi:alpha-ketoglutarate-dependent taurine dioxygenase